MGAEKKILQRKEIIFKFVGQAIKKNFARKPKGKKERQLYTFLCVFVKL